MRPRVVMRARTRSTVGQQGVERFDGERLGNDRDDQAVGRDDRVDVEQRQARRAVEDDQLVVGRRRARACAAASFRGRGRRTARRRRWRARSSRAARSRFGASVWRTALRMGYFSSRHDADGRPQLMARHAQPEGRGGVAVEIDERGRGAWATARAAARLTAVVVLPTPPLLFRTAMTTGNLSGILSTNISMRRERAIGGRLQCERQCRDATGAVARADDRVNGRRHGTFGWLRKSSRGGETSEAARGVRHGRRRWRRWTPAAVRTLEAALRRTPPLADDLEIEEEMLDALRQLLELERELAAAPRADRGNDATEWWGRIGATSARPVSMPDDPAQPTGRLLLTSTRAVFAGGARTPALPWHAAREVIQSGRDLLFVFRNAQRGRRASLPLQFVRGRAVRRRDRPAPDPPSGAAARRTTIIGRCPSASASNDCSTAPIAS